MQIKKFELITFRKLARKLCVIAIKSCRSLVYIKKFWDMIKSKILFFSIFKSILVLFWATKEQKTYKNQNSGEIYKIVDISHAQNHENCVFIAHFFQFWAYFQGAVYCTYIVIFFNLSN